MGQGFTCQDWPVTYLVEAGLELIPKSLFPSVLGLQVSASMTGFKQLFCCCCLLLFFSHDKVKTLGCCGQSGHTEHTLYGRDTVPPLGGSIWGPEEEPFVTQHGGN